MSRRGFAPPSALRLVAAMALLASAAAAAAPRPLVLLLHSHYQGYPWSDAITAGFAEGLAAAGAGAAAGPAAPGTEAAPPPPELLVAYLDSRRDLDQGYRRAFLAWLEARLAGRRVDLLAVADNEALAFAASIQGAPPPALAGAPLVFCGINYYEPSMAAPIAEATGVTEELAMRDTVELALALRPKARRALVLLGDNPSARVIQGLFRAEAEEPLRGRIDFEYRAGLDLPGLAEAAGRAAPEDLVFLLNISRDASGAAVAPAEAAAAVAAASRAPVFSFWDFYLGRGLLGGRLASGRDQGLRAAALARRVLAGERASSIPAERGRPGPPSFEWAALRRFGIAESALPPGSLVLGKPESFLERYGPVLGASAAALAAMGAVALALALLLGRARRAEASLRASESELRRSLAEKEVLLREVHHRVKNNLQLIAALLNLGAPDDESPEAVRVRASRARVETMALVHEELYAAEGAAELDLGRLAAEIAARLAQTYGYPAELVRPVAEGAPRLPLDRALPAALALEELLGNAFLHAYPPGRPGPVELRVGVGAFDAVYLEIEDGGAGLPPGLEPERSDSVGFLIVRQLAAQLGASLSFRRPAAGDLAARLEVPVRGRG